MGYDAAEHSRIPAARHPAASRSAADRRPERGRQERGRQERGREDLGRSSQPYAGEGRARAGEPHGRPDAGRGRASTPPDTGSGVRGVVAVLAVFLVTLAGGAVDSLFMGMGLDLITLGCLVGSTVLATALVRRRDLLSVVVAPPLVFVAVACINIAVAPSATLSLPTMATLLVRGFPTMAMATGTALVIALIRWAARR